MTESEKSEQTTDNTIYSTHDINKKNISTNTILNSSKCDVKSEITSLKIISDLLTDICEENKTHTENKSDLSNVFYSKRIPNISIEDYLSRLQKYAKVNDSTIILILIYIDRICNKNKVKLSYYNIHKIILASFVTAIKYNEDDYYSSKFYANIGGVSEDIIFLLEYEFLSLIDFNLFVDISLFNKYNDYITNFENEEEEEESENEEESV